MELKKTTHYTLKQLFYSLHNVPSVFALMVKQTLRKQACAWG